MKRLLCLLAGVLLWIPFASGVTQYITPEGFEGSAAQSWAGDWTSLGASISTSNPYEGTHAHLSNYSAGNTAYNMVPASALTGKTEHWARMRFRYNGGSFPAGNIDVMGLRSSGFAERFRLFVDSGGHIFADDNAGHSIAAGATAMSVGTYYEIKLHFGPFDGTHSPAEIYLNGVSQGSSNAFTTSASAVGFLYIGQHVAGAVAGNFNIDYVEWQDVDFPAATPKSQGTMTGIGLCLVHGGHSEEIADERRRAA